MGLSGYYFVTEGGEKCYNNRDNVMFGIAMYISYFLLFAGAPLMGLQPSAGKQASGCCCMYATGLALTE